eukprot:759294-Rhodomonas_salina.1
MRTSQDVHDCRASATAANSPASQPAQHRRPTHHLALLDLGEQHVAEREVVRGGRAHVRGERARTERLVGGVMNRCQRAVRQGLRC